MGIWPSPAPRPGVPLDLGPLRFRKVRHKNLVCLLGVILHNGLYIVMEFMSKVRAPSRSSASGPVTTQTGGQNPPGVGWKPGTAAPAEGKVSRQPPAIGPYVFLLLRQGNLVNFLRTRGRARVPTQQLLLFSL